MASTARHTFEQREILIIEAATLLFSKHGFQGTTTKMIAEAAKVNEALIFRHFPKKEDLYTAIIELKLKEWVENVIPALEKGLPPDMEAALLEIAQVMVRENKKDPSCLRMMLFSALEKHELSRLFFQKRLPLIEFLEAFFKRQIREKRVRLLRTDEVARAFLGMIHHYILVSQLFDAGAYFKRKEPSVLKSYVDLFVKGIAA